MLINGHGGNTRSVQQSLHDLRVSFPVEVIHINGTDVSIHFKQRPAHSPLAGSSCRNQGAINIKKQEVVHSEEAFEPEGEMARRRSTVRGNTSSTASISELLVQRPKVKQTEPSISSERQPIALST